MAPGDGRRIEHRIRKSPFIRLFDRTHASVVCPHFYELILSNGCPYACAYCYLQLTFRGKSHPRLYNNDWQQVEKELDAIAKGVFSTGELADSLAITPPLLSKALDYFASQSTRYLLLLTKSTNVRLLQKRKASRQVIVSFSINSVEAHRRWEHGTPSPDKRLECAGRLKEQGWRVRIRLDPIILEGSLSDYRPVCERLAALAPEMVTIGTLRQFPQLDNFAPHAPRKGLELAGDGRMRYPLEQRLESYRKIAEWLGFQPALCKETKGAWRQLGWWFQGCNCTS